MTEKMNLQIQVRIGNSNYGGSGLELNERFDVVELSFGDIASIMSRFHDLFEEIRKSVRT